MRERVKRDKKYLENIKQDNQLLYDLEWICCGCEFDWGCNHRTNRNSYCKQYFEIKRNIVASELIRRYPEEVGFVNDCDTYEDYLNTYTEYMNSEDFKPVLTKSKYNIIKKFLNERKSIDKGNNL